MKYSIFAKTGSLDDQSVNLTPLSSIFLLFLRGSERVEFLSPLVDGFGNSRDCLDSASNLNSTRSDWVLVYASSKVSVLRQKDLHKEWTFISPPIHRCSTTSDHRLLLFVHF